VDVHCDSAVTAGQRDEIDRWVGAQDSDAIDTVVVGARVIAVHGTINGLGVTGTSFRRGSLSIELAEALTSMRKIPRRRA
jgi:hypothetical protein